MKKYGFVYLWYDKKHCRYYVGSHWGTETDSYICSSPWMKSSYKRRSQDFRRRILKRIYSNRKDLIAEEFRYLGMIKEEELGTRYYNLRIHATYTRGHSKKQHTQETKDKISKAKKENPTKFWYGKTRDLETKQKISKAKIGTIQTQEHKQINSSKIKELWKDPQWREKMLNARKKK